jgi:hypothetical protein
MWSMSLQVIAPEDISNSVAVAVTGETEDERERRDNVFFAIIDFTNLQREKTGGIEA